MPYLCLFIVKYGGKVLSNEPGLRLWSIGRDSSSLCIQLILTFGQDTYLATPYFFTKNVLKVGFLFYFSFILCKNLTTMSRIATKKTFSRNGHNVSIATLDKKNPKIFYIEGSLYVRPIIGKPCEDDFVSIRNNYSYCVRQITRGDTIKTFDTAMGKYERADKVYIRYQYYIRNNKNLSFPDIVKNYDEYVAPVINNLEQKIKDIGYTIVERRIGKRKDVCA